MAQTPFPRYRVLPSPPSSQREYIECQMEWVAVKAIILKKKGTIKSVPIDRPLNLIEPSEKSEKASLAARRGNRAIGDCVQREQRIVRASEISGENLAMRHGRAKEGYSVQNGVL
ncbi:hypothetical protein KM043_007626 [Ampulex compressa]|nr:hypothetical protein KM043_007626 [Ampulex compressa]